MKSLVIGTSPRPFSIMVSAGSWLEELRYDPFQIWSTCDWKNLTSVKVVPKPYPKAVN
jgi:hypothetical protein